MPDARNNPSRPHVGVGAAIFKGDLILLIKRGKPPKKGEWSLPGGGQKLGETLREAIVREVKEETGLNIKVGVLLDVVDFIDQNHEQVAFHYTLIDFVAEYTSGTLEAMSDATDAQFFSLDEALSLPLWTETKRIILMAAKNRSLL